MSDSAPQLIEDFNKSLKGGKKRHGNSSLKAWVKFVKKVAKEEKLPYGAAMKRAKVRKDKGEKWMMGGVVNPDTGKEEDPVVLRAEATRLRTEATRLRELVPPNETEAAALETEAAALEAEAAAMGMEGGRRRKGKSQKKQCGGSKKRRGGRRGTKKRRY